MTGEETDWLRYGEGERPQPVWSFTTEAPLVAMQFARESGEVLAADASGGLYRLGRDGRLQTVSRGPSPVKALAWGDTGRGGIALVGDEKLYWFDRQLSSQGWIEQTVPVNGVAFDAHGDYAVVCLSTAVNVIYNAHRKVVRRFNSTQPMVNVQFMVHEPALVATTDFGLICCHDFNGNQLWQQQLFAGAGDMAITGDGQTILLACFAHGIQCHDGRGVQIGSYQLGGTVSRIATGFTAGRIAAATQERHFYYLDAEGQVIWQSLLPDDVLRVVCEPFGFGVVCGFRSGRIQRLDWRPRS